MHIPYIAEIPQTELYALSDPVTERVETLGNRYNVPHRFGDADSLVAEIGDELDAVVVLTPPSMHPDVVETTLGADIPTLVEKPLAVSPTDADRMVSAAESSNATAMVAYMKRYDPTYERAKEEIAALDDIDLVTAYDVDPDHGRIIEEVYDIVDGSAPESVIEETRQKQRAKAKDAIATDDSDLAADYHWHLEHICHDVNLLRGLFGEVSRIEHVDLFADRRYMTAHLVYDGEIRCTLDSGLSERKWFEEFVRVDTPDGMVRIEFSNPFIRNTPTELRMKRGIEELSDEAEVVSYEESFKRELKQFVACVRDGDDVRTTFEEGRSDVRLIADLFRAHQETDLLGTY